MMRVVRAGVARSRARTCASRRAAASSSTRRCSSPSSCVLVFAFAFVREGQADRERRRRHPLGGHRVLGTLALGRTFERERQAETLRALLLAPVERRRVYLGKLLGVLLAARSASRSCSCRSSALLFDAPLGARAAGCWSALLAAGTVGFAAVGTLFAAMLVPGAVARRAAAGRAVSDHRAGAHRRRAGHRAPSSRPSRTSRWPQTWLAMLVFFDAVFVTLALWTFAPVMTRVDRHGARPTASFPSSLVASPSSCSRARRSSSTRRRTSRRWGSSSRSSISTCPSAMTMLCRRSSAASRAPCYLFRAQPARRSRRARGRRTRGRLRPHRARHRTAVGAQGLGHLVGLGSAAHEHARHVDDLRRVSAAAPLRRPGSEVLAAAVGSSAWRSCRSSTGRSTSGARIHPKTSVVPTLPARHGAVRSVFCCGRVHRCFTSRCCRCACGSNAAARSSSEAYLALED